MCACAHTYMCVCLSPAEDYFSVPGQLPTQPDGRSNRKDHGGHRVRVPDL